MYIYIYIYIHTYIHTFFFPQFAISFLGTLLCTISSTATNSSEELLCQLAPTFAKLNGAMENLQTKRELRVKRNS